jgi:hypothetical protein
LTRRLWPVLVGLALVAFAALYLASPVLSFRALSDAARDGDAGRLARQVDFPAVRDSLKPQLRARVADLDTGPLGALGALLGGRIVDQVVDIAVTPEAVAAMVRTGQARLADAVPTPPATPPPADQRKARTGFAYDGLDRFRVTRAPADAPDRPLALVLERRGLMDWKLTAIELPPE